MQTEVVLVNPKRYARRDNPGLPLGLPSPKAVLKQFDWRQMVGGMAGAVATTAIPKFLSKPLGKFAQGWWGIGWSAVTALFGGFMLKKWNATFGAGFIVGGLAITGLRAIRKLLGGNKLVKKFTTIDGLGDEFLYGSMEQDSDIELFGDENYFGSWSPEQSGDRTIEGFADEAFEGAFGELNALDDNLVPTFTGY
jgi:hypothetical protein